MAEVLSPYQQQTLLTRLKEAGLTPYLANRVIESRGNLLAKKVVQLLDNICGRGPLPAANGCSPHAGPHANGVCR